MTIMQKVYWLIATLGNLFFFSLYFLTDNFFSLTLAGLTLVYTLVGFYDLFLVSQPEPPLSRCGLSALFS